MSQAMIKDQIKLLKQKANRLEQEQHNDSGCGGPSFVFATKKKEEEADIYQSILALQEHFDKELVEDNMKSGKYDSAFYKQY